MRKLNFFSPTPILSSWKVSALLSIILCAAITASLLEAIDAPGIWDKYIYSIHQSSIDDSRYLIFFVFWLISLYSLIPKLHHYPLASTANQQTHIQLSAPYLSSKHPSPLSFSCSHFGGECTNSDLLLYKTLFEMSSDAMIITNAEARIIHVNPAFSRITGFSASEAVGKRTNMLKSKKQDTHFYKSLWENLHRNQFWQGEIWNKRKDESIFPAWQTINAIGPKEKPSHFISVFSDITHLKETEDQLWHLAHYDSLTGLANRKLLEERLNQELSSAKRLQHSGALLFMDLDNFKTINDSLGHKTGDQLLSDIALRLKKLYRKEDTVARLGGDEFIIMLSNLPADPKNIISHVASIVNKTLLALEQPIEVNMHELRISASIGITLFSRLDQSAECLLKQADTAMYMAKRNGKHSYCFYHPDMQIEVDKRLEMEKELHQALQDDQFDLVYQPQYDRYRTLLGYEALVRWQHPKKGVISPVDFIPISEENGMIIEISDVVLRKACRQLRSWENAGMAPPHLSVNISPRQFRDDRFIEKTKSILLETQADPSRIIMEITEGVIVQNVSDSISKMQKLKALGITFSIDDFGTGYSSLAYLTLLPIDQLKIDRSFVHNMVEDKSNAAIVNTIIAMAKVLNLNLIAEGVETEPQVNHLVKCGCHCFQGFYFSRPLSSDSISSPSLPPPS
jgi:diguanylate cyclase (GGDEF)-like protein/PAS domain S-box-containing protein